MKKGLQTIVAKKAKISLPFMSLILSGSKRPSWPVSKRLEKATGISAVAWIDGKVDRDFLEEHYNSGIANRRKCNRRKKHGRRITNKPESSNEFTPEENVNE